MDKISIVTGGGTGIGRALAIELAKSGRKVLIVGRRKSKLMETQSHYPQQISWLQADVSLNVDLKKIFDNINQPIEYLVQNAAVLGKIVHLSEISLDEWKKVMAINVDAPLFLTQLLLKKMDNTRVLHISSGAAHYAIAGWGAYCTSKAALMMIYELFKTEIPKEKAIFASVKPGIVDTDMQNLIRKADLKKMPHLVKFHDLFKENKLEPLSRVSKYLFWLLTQTKAEHYSAKEWDIRDEAYQALWDN